LALLAGCAQADLYTNLPESEANEMIAILRSNGIEAAKAAATEGKFKVTVVPSRFAEATSLLRRDGYPRDQFTNVGEMFQRAGLVSSPMEDRVRFIYATSQQLAETLSNIDGVMTVRVQIVPPRNDPLQDALPSSASVFIKHRPTADLEPLVPRIKMLVVNGVEGLTFDNVTVVLVPAEMGYGPVSLAPAAVTWSGGLIVGIVLGTFTLVFAVAMLFRSFRGSEPGAKP
jgi:type III secretion protein J